MENKLITALALIEHEIHELMDNALSGDGCELEIEKLKDLRTIQLDLTIAIGKHSRLDR